MSKPQVNIVTSVGLLHIWMDNLELWYIMFSYDSER